jgi:ParB/RepB/Spo0J family partition protein
MACKLMHVKIASLRRSNIRKYFDHDKVAQLGESLRTMGQLQPILVGPGAVDLYDGEYRVLAAELIGMPELLAMVSDEPITPEKLPRLQFATAVHRNDLTGYEKYEFMAALRDASPQATIAELAREVSLDAKMVKILLSPSACIPEAREALKHGGICISDCYTLSLQPLEEQAILLEERLSGVSRDELARRGRKRRNRTASAVRTNSIRMALGSGITLILKGTDISLDDAIEALPEAQKEMRRAREQGHDVKTFQALIRKRESAAS